MYRLIILLASLAVAIGLRAEIFTYSFSNTPLSKALAQMSEEHPDAHINFIYNEIEGYRTSARISTDDALTAVREAVGFNPVAVTALNGAIYAEALQHGRYDYHGRVRNSAGEAIEGATVMFLAGKDSVMVTYAVTDRRGGFHIPCDRKNIIAKVSCVGYHTRYVDPKSFDMGNITLIDLPIKLKGVTVKPDDAYMLSDRTVYLPSSRQKNAAQDAVDLLRAMAIPQIIITPTGDLSDLAGDDVKIFINSLPASEEEQKGLRTADVRRVEYLTYPTDARYGGARKVINFIVQEYLYGGYTKISDSESVLTGLQSSASVFSKFVYKKMTYNLYVGARNSDSRHNGESITGDYLLTDSRGERYHVIREEGVDDSQIKNNSYPVTLQATYASGNLYMINTVGFTHSGSPDNFYAGSLRYSDDPSRGYTYTHSNPNKSNSLSYTGYFYKSFPHGVTFNLTPMFRYTHRNDHLLYSTSRNPDMIDRVASENASLYMVNFNISKDFGTTHSISLKGGSMGDISDVDYASAESTNNSFNHITNSFGLYYTLSLGRIRLTFSESNSFNHSKSNGIVDNNFRPHWRANADYSINDKNSVSLLVGSSNKSYGIYYRTTDVLRINEFMYATGNPSIKTTPMFDVYADYTWLPSSKFYLSSSVDHHVQYRTRKEIYEPYDDGRALLRTVTNEGQYHRTTIRLNATLKLFDGKLQLNVTPQQYFYRVTGLFAKRYNPFVCWAGANLYLDKWYFNVQYNSPSNMLDYGETRIIRQRNSYWVTAGWSNGTWNLRLSSDNMFNRGWKGDSQTFDSEYYSFHSVANTTQYHPRINFAVTYTIGYGKKVNRGGEVGEQGSAGTAILK